MSGHSGAVCLGPTRLRSGSPLTLRRAACPGGHRNSELSSPLPPSRQLSSGPGGNPCSGQRRAVPGQPPRGAPRASPAEPRLRRAAGSRRSREGTFRPAPKSGTPGRAARVSDRLGGRRVVLGKSAFARPETFQFLRTEPKDGGEADSLSSLPLLDVPLSLVLNSRSPSPSLRLRYHRGGRLGFWTHLNPGMRVSFGAVAEGDCSTLEWTKSLDRVVCGDKRQL